MQRAVSSVWVSLPHCWKHCIGPPPAFTQASSQWRAVAQAGSARHVAACVQHLAWMQFPQRVPSVGHGEAPQIPAVHCAVQHSAALAHAAPSGLQTGGPEHTPFWQVPVQQVGVVGPHAEPAGAQVCGPQMPLLQVPEQQGVLPAAQGFPSVPHGG